MAAREDKRRLEKWQRRGLDVPVLLARWRAREVRVAQRFRECGGTPLAEVEELYDASVAAIVEKGKTYESVEHLRAVLHKAVKARALRLHRDRQTRAQRLAAAAPSMHRFDEERAWRTDPAQALIAHEDDVIVGEFIAELTPLERRVFALCAEGRSWRAIATALRIPETQARNATRACERKRERFVTLYSTGRLCGYRSHTIATVLDGHQSTDIAIRQALAHLRHCQSCQAQHRTSENQLRTMFDKRALIFLPPSVPPHAWSWLLDRLQEPLVRALRLMHRIPSPQTGARERALEAIAGSGAAAKLAAGALGVAVLAGGAIGVSGSLEHHHHARGHQVHHRRSTPSPIVVKPSSPAGRSRSPGGPTRAKQYEPRGFAYLGIPAPPRHKSRITQSGGGPFGP